MVKVELIYVGFLTFVAQSSNFPGYQNKFGMNQLVGLNCSSSRKNRSTQFVC